MTISERELPGHSFSERDAVLVTDAVQVEFLSAKSNASLGRSWMFPLSMQAYTALLRRAHPKVRSYFDCVDFDSCKRWYCETAPKHSRDWLRELGLELVIEGIDLAELDATCQFLLFTHAVYLAETAERLIRSSPEIETFYLVRAEEPLPLDFYFDADVASAVLRFVCDSLGRQVRMIVMANRPHYVFPHFRQRPVTKGRSKGTTDQQPGAERYRLTRPLVGFVPATVANHQQVLDGIRKTGCNLVVFSSTWPMPPAFNGGRSEINECVYSLAEAHGEWSNAVAAQLGNLARRFFERRARSTLPDCIVHNPHLDFQFDYLFRHRWLSYANMIRGGIGCVARMPLDLFIHSDHFTPEGAILAHLYRRKGTRVMVTLHSAWPCARHWGCWHPADAAMVASRSCAERMREVYGMSDVFVTGSLPIRTYQSLIQCPEPLDAGRGKRRAAGDRKIVLFVTNALELNGVPFTDPASHFETISVLGKIPDSLKGRILLVIRPKPGLGEGTTLYRELCKIPQESFAFLDGCDFSQSIEAADCVVGINIPTSGYFEILQKGVPLVHVQTADVTSLEPDLPSTVIHRITKLHDVWPMVEAILFDPLRREQVLAVQRRFVTADHEPAPFCGRDPVEALIRRLVGSRIGSSIRRLPLTWRRLVVARPWYLRDSLSLKENCLPCSAQGGAGHVDDLLLGSDRTGLILGWAADLTACRPAKAVYVFVNGRCVGWGSPWQPRADVAAVYNDNRLEPSGFAVPLMHADKHMEATLSVYAELHNGRFFKLPAIAVNAASKA